jgi:polyphosphate kinase
MKNPVFTGAGVAIITPMYEDGSINFDELGRIVEDQIARGTDAIVICGTTGECSTMTDEEQLAAIMPKTAQLQEDCDKYYAKALENLAACGYRKVDLDKLSKEDEHFWKKYFQSELFPILSPQIVDSRHPFPFLRNKEIYLGVLLHEKHTSEHTLGIVPISSQMERMHFVRKDNETCFA